MAVKLNVMMVILPFALLGTNASWACDEPRADVLVVSPESGATEVPRDARVVLQVRGGSESELGVEVVRDGIQVEGEWFTEWTVDGRGLATFVPTRPLDPRTVYAVRPPPTSENYDAATAWLTEFETGDALARPLELGPAVSFVDVGQAVDGMEDRCEPERYRRASVAVTPGPVDRPTESWLSLYLIGDDGDQLLEARRSDGRDWSTPLEVRVPTGEDGFCLLVAQRNAAGEERIAAACYEDAPIPEEQTVAYYGGAGCPASGCRTSTAWFGAWLLLPLWMRRRR